MKGVLLSRNPDLQIVDITHSIRPQDIRHGAIVVDDVCHRFPPRTIHVVVVDPGVGTQREVVFAKLGAQRYVAPNNGLLTLAALRTPPDLIVAVTNRLYFLPEVAPTFHGRDIMAPTAAHISLGLHPERLGPRLDSLISIPAIDAVAEPTRILGRVLQIDSFGNVVTNISAQQWSLVPTGLPVRVCCNSHEVTEIVATYGQRPPGTIVALLGSSGRLEVAEVNGNAAARLGITEDQEVTVTW
jgi:S-adenosylmethionine hydrolase